MTPLRIEHVTKRFGATVAVDDVSLRVEPGELFFLLGPSGCGKTTLLRILAGFEQPDAGELYFGAQCITHLPPRNRDAGMVFQTYALWPHLTVARNVAYGLNVRGVSKTETARRVTDALKMVRMEGYGERKPNQLSGGQQQRVALARALVVQPRIVLLDEPLSNLDARLRDEMREEVRRLHRETGLTMVYVTHDQKEALALADRLAVMDRGRIVQVGRPAEVYDQPANPFVAGFLGESNFLTGRLRSRTENRWVVETEVGPLEGTASIEGLKEGTNVVCSIRPQALFFAGDNGANRIPGTVDHVAFLGELLQIRVQTPSGVTLQVLALPQQTERWRPGTKVTLGASPENVVLLAARE
jgi:iron(III) transport system ATP-binding protein